MTDPVIALSAEALTEIPHVRHAFFTRRGGASDGLYASLNGGLGSGDERARVIENRARMAGHLGLDGDALVSVHQIHSPDVFLVTKPHEAERPKADAMVCATPGLALAVATADCGPLLFADEESRVIGAAHAGWKGALAGVLENTVAAMESLGAKRENIIAALGPTIAQESYEVGPEFVARFVETDSSLARFFAPSEKKGRAMFDLPAFILARLGAAGVRAVHVAHDTYADENLFYSYRRSTHRGEPDYGRLISAIALA